MTSRELDKFVALAPLHRSPIVSAVRDWSSALPRGSRVLDAGAGESPYREFFSHCEYITQDWENSPHAGAHRADLRSDVCSLPLPDASMDALLCTEVLEHVTDTAAALTEFYRVLAQGGHLFLSVPFVIELHEDPYDFNRLTSYGLKAAVQAAGFTNVRVRPTSGWYTTLAQVVTNAGVSTIRVGSRPRLRQRVAAVLLSWLGKCIGRFASRLDGALDNRRALPLGWIADARRP